MPIELTLLGWSTLLLFAHVAAQGQLGTRDRGIDWNAGPRDGDAAPLGPLAGRAERALRNFAETYPAFIALALGLAVSDRMGGLGATGAITWFAARALYLPIYIAGIRYLRSLIWGVSMLGLLMMLVAFL